MAVGLVIYSKARAFKAKAKSSRPRPENIKGHDDGAASCQIIWTFVLS